jgi:protein TonB
LQPIFVELAPAPAAQKIQAQDLAPGPSVQEAEAPPYEPPKIEKIEEQLAPTPPLPQPVVAAPPKAESRSERVPPKPTPIPDKRPVKKQLVQPSTAAKADRIAPDTPALAPGRSAAAATGSYISRLATHLARFKQQPAGGRPGEYGKPIVSLTIARDGRLLSSRLAQSSGFASIDQAALATVRSAQPMPQFPPEMRQASDTFQAPFSYVRE